MLTGETIEGLVVLPPMTRLVKFTDGVNTKTVELAFPYTVFWKSSISGIQDFHVGFCNEDPNKNQNTIVWVPPLTHVNKDGSVCLQSNGEDDDWDDDWDDYDIDLEEAFYDNSVEELITVFFGSANVINNSIIGDTSLRTLQSWVKRTAKEELSFITKVNWNRQMCLFSDIRPNEQVLSTVWEGG